MDWLWTRKARLSYIFFIAILICGGAPFLLNLYLPITKTHERALGTCLLNPPYKVACLPNLQGESLTQEICEAALCCWRSNMDDLLAPLCFHSYPSAYSFFHERKKKRETLATWKLESNMRKTPFGGRTLTSVFFSYSSNEDQAVLTFTNVRDVVGPIRSSSRASGLELRVVDSELFFIQLIRTSNKTILLDTSSGGLMFGKNYSEVTIRPPTSFIYGLPGDHIKLKHDFQWTRQTISNRREINAGGASLHAPFYMGLEEGGNAHGVLIDTEDTIEVSFQPLPSITFRILSSDMDPLLRIRVFPGPTPRDVLRQLTDYIGKPKMPPYWALGYHTCRAAPNISVFQDVLNLTRIREIPFDGDCISSSIQVPGAFTFEDLEEWSELDEEVQALHDAGYKFFMPFSPHVAYESSPELSPEQLLPFQSGKNESIFVTYYNESLEWIGEYDDVLVVYPDPSNPNMGSWMNSSLQRFMENLNLTWKSVDGALLKDVSPRSDNTSLYPWESLENDNLQYLPPRDMSKNDPLFSNTIWWGALHSTGVWHWEYHNRYADEFSSTFRDAVGPPELLIADSMSIIAGKNEKRADGWLASGYRGDWWAMKKSLITIMEAGLVGIPFAGVPVCGDLETEYLDQVNTLGDLCTRWNQLATFYPLAVNHYGRDSTPRHPTDFSASVTDRIRIALRQRYRFLPYLYSRFVEASETGLPVVRPFFLEYPEDSQSRDVDEQFLIGSALMMVPSLDSKRVVVSTYFPPGRWMDFYSGVVLTETGRTNISIPVAGFQFQVAVKAGHIIPYQDVKNNSAESRLTNFTLTVALDKNGSAKGDLYFGSPSNFSRLLFEARTKFVMNGTDDSLFNATGISPVTVTELVFELEMGRAKCQGDEGTYIFTVINRVRVFGFGRKNSAIAYIDCGGWLEKLETNFQLGILDIFNVNIDFCELSKEACSLRLYIQ
ncbi:unnamed protein product [Darwinula stevensoni]|uniref:P-type domain-containing protein n=1 Tax=Darwinula stevensoni TaxID=69355 RepID=A0A7R8XCL5_9CRUS|nr:unnamed protein product [Darwinula stevensoni]CAG0887694.1 unnamed protein product [Darwinula stevensoni]